MKLSTRSRYGLRALTALARHEGQVVPAETLAAEEGVSKKYLDSILAALRRAGLLESIHGAAGGYRLARPAKELTAADVVGALEEGLRGLQARVHPCGDVSDARLVDCRNGSNAQRTRKGQHRRTRYERCITSGQGQTRLVGRQSGQTLASLYPTKNQPVKDRRMYPSRG
jgi:Rrf2 family protein